MKVHLTALSLLFSLSVPVIAQADWQLDPSQSRVEATITQITPDGPIARQHHIRELRGEIAPDGTLTLPLRLSQTDVAERLGQLPPWLSGITNVSLVTLVTQLPPERLEALDIGESMTETLNFRIRAENDAHEEPVELRFTRHGLDHVHVTTAEPVAVDGRELMANQTARTVMLLLGYEEIGDEVPVELNVNLVNR